MSTKPGATTLPSASITRPARVLPRRPIPTMRPSRTPTSAVNAGRPDPSTTVPPRIRTSSSGTRGTVHLDAVLVALLDAVHLRRVRTHDLALLLGGQLRDVFEELVDDPGELRVGVWEVAGPDEVVLARELGHRAHRALTGIEADHAIAPEVLARCQFERRGERPVVGLEELVE